MGVGITNNGVTVQLVNEKGEPVAPPIHGFYAAAFGEDRETILQDSATQDEIDFHGSEDWLTFVAVADSADKLESMLPKEAENRLPAETSGSSRRVQVDVDVAGFRQTFSDRVTIASGPLLNVDPPKFHMVHIKVLPPGLSLGDLAAADPNHPLVLEFHGNSILFQ